MPTWPFLSDVCININLIDDDSSEIIKGANGQVSLVSCKDGFTQVENVTEENADGSFTVCGLRENDKYAVTASAYTYATLQEECGTSAVLTVPAENSTFINKTVNKNGKTLNWQYLWCYFLRRHILGHWFLSIRFKCTNSLIESLNFSHA